jgi:hypothetical protein
MWNRVPCILYLYYVDLYWNRKRRERFQGDKRGEMKLLVPDARKYQDKLTIFPQEYKRGSRQCQSWYSCY